MGSFSSVSKKKLTKRVLAVSLIFIILLSGKSVVGKISTESETVSYSAENFNTLTDYFEGYNLYILERQSTISHDVIDRKILLTNMDNSVIYEKNIPNTLAVADVQFFNTSTVLYGDIKGMKMWNIETDVTVDLGFGGHHDIEVNYLNHTFLTMIEYKIELDNITYEYDNITEHDFSGALIRSIDTRNYVEPWQTCPFVEMFNNTLDLSHANSLFFDEDEQVIYFNCRNVNTFYKIDYNTGKLMWGVGEYGNFTMYDIFGNEQEHLFFHAHSVEKIGTNKFLLFDNDYHNQTSVINGQSRFIEITVDEDSMTANVTREWIGPEKYFSQIWGDCDLLPNSNLFGVFGYTKDFGRETGSKIVEVNEDGEIVWLLESPLDQGIKYTTYRVERFRFTPIVSTPTLVSSNNSSHFEWNVWYNFKSRTTYDGEYYIYLDSQLMESGNITFSKYWQSIQLNYTAENLDPGKHEISLIVTDDKGHSSNESDFYTGGFVFRIGQNLGVILGVSLGVGIPIMATSVIVGRKYFRKRI